MPFYFNHFNGTLSCLRVVLLSGKFYKGKWHHTIGIVKHMSEECDDLLRSFLCMIISELNDSKNLDEAKAKMKCLSILLCFLEAEAPLQKPPNVARPLNPVLLA